MFERLTEPESYILSRWVFLRLLALAYLFAFLSMWSQVNGLIGEDGIIPAREFLQAVQANLGAERYWIYPTLFWFNASNLALQLVSAGGALLSILALAGIAVRPILILLWVFYLSLCSVGGPFMSFQWDALLLETGFLSIVLAFRQTFLAPCTCWHKNFRQAEPPRIFVWLLRWLLFRLVFLSGAVKLLSGDPNWRNLTALDYHYLTQPLPTPVAWYAAQLPDWFNKLSVASMFALELAVPFLIFAPRRIRFVGAGLICFLQLLIALTGNYTFFNFLAISLCVLLLDDRFLSRFLPGKLKERILVSVIKVERRPRLYRFSLAGVAAILIAATTTRFIDTIGGSVLIPMPVAQAVDWLSPLEIANSYGVFAVMTTSRLEIVVEGSNDLQTWRAYEFKYKPGDLMRPPPWVAPHQPRLDWQMWFAALGTYRQNPWFIRFLLKLLDGSHDVLALLETNPFPDRPPVYIRASLYNYHFTDMATRNATGAWWKREYVGTYMPIFSLEH